MRLESWVAIAKVFEAHGVETDECLLRDLVSIMREEQRKSSMLCRIAGNVAGAVYAKYDPQFDVNNETIAEANNRINEDIAEQAVDIARKIIEDVYS